MLQLDGFPTGEGVQVKTQRRFECTAQTGSRHRQTGSGNRTGLCSRLIDRLADWLDPWWNYRRYRRLWRWRSRSIRWVSGSNTRRMLLPPPGVAVTRYFSPSAETGGPDEAGPAGKTQQVSVWVQSGPGSGPVLLSLTRFVFVSERRSEEAAPRTPGKDHSAQREAGESTGRPTHLEVKGQGGSWQHGPRTGPCCPVLGNTDQFYCCLDWFCLYRYL